MSWNHRVMSLDGGKSFGIHEVYYHDDGTPWMFTENSIKPFGDNPQELKEELMQMIRAFDSPVLTPEDFPEEKNTNEI
jgi:hypothetical protein